MTSQTIYTNFAPPTIQQLSNMAFIKFDNKIPLKEWIKQVQVWRNQATIQNDDGDIDGAFVLLVKVAKVTIEDAPKHPGYTKITADQSRELHDLSQSALIDLQDMKPVIKARYEAWAASQAQSNTNTSATGAVQTQSYTPVGTSQAYQHSKLAPFPSPSSEPTSLPLGRSASADRVTSPEPGQEPLKEKKEKKGFRKYFGGKGKDKKDKDNTVATLQQERNSVDSNESWEDLSERRALYPPQKNEEYLNLSLGQFDKLHPSPLYAMQRKNTSGSSLSSSHTTTPSITYDNKSQGSQLSLQTTFTTPISSYHSPTTSYPTNTKQPHSPNFYSPSNSTPTATTPYNRQKPTHFTEQSGIGPQRMEAGIEYHVSQLAINQMNRPPQQPPVIDNREFQSPVSARHRESPIVYPTPSLQNYNNPMSRTGSSNSVKAIQYNTPAANQMNQSYVHSPLSLPHPPVRAAPPPTLVQPQAPTPVSESIIYAQPQLQRAGDILAYPQKQSPVGLSHGLQGVAGTAGGTRKTANQTSLHSRHSIMMPPEEQIASLQRRMSRLTPSHQAKQGYIPPSSSQSRFLNRMSQADEEISFPLTYPSRPDDENMGGQSTPTQSKFSISYPVPPLSHGAREFHAERRGSTHSINSAHSMPFVHQPPSPSVLSRRERPLSQGQQQPPQRVPQRFVYPELQNVYQQQQQQAPAPQMQNVQVPAQLQAPPRPKKEPLANVQQLQEDQFEDPYRLKPMRFPSQIVDTFLGLSDRNTRMGIETLGLLLGKEVGKEYRITTLLIPKQSGTPDTCAMDEDMSAFEYGWEKELNQLGWIHTHPTQATFMSSVDLHTHMNYQSTLREAIAIVCAPTSQPSYGIFRLTDPPGLKIIQECREGPQFHPHAELPIYTDADGYNGHAIPTFMDLHVCDLRNGKNEFKVPQSQ